VIRDDHRKPLARYSAMGGALAPRLAPPSYTTTGDVTFSTGDQNFCGLRAQFSCKDVKDLIA
jgi:hypothetical protein